METITYSEVQELIMRLPTTKLPLAYKLLVSLADNEADLLPPQITFMLLSPTEKQRILEQQAAAMVEHYEQTAPDREDWQAGDFIYED